MILLYLPGSLDSEFVDFVDDFVTDKVLDNIEKDILIYLKSAISRSS